MTRLKSIPLAIGGLVLMAGTVAAFAALPDAATPGLQKATEVSGKTVPVRAVPADAPAVDVPALEPAEAPAVDLPDAASTAPLSQRRNCRGRTGTNHGADVAAVARDNVGQATATEPSPPPLASRPMLQARRSGQARRAGASIGPSRDLPRDASRPRSLAAPSDRAVACPELGRRAARTPSIRPGRLEWSRLRTDEGRAPDGPSIRPTGIDR